MKRILNFIGYISIIILSIAFIIMGNNYAKSRTNTLDIFEKEIEMNTGVIAKVENITSIVDNGNTNIVQFNAKILTGDYKNNFVCAEQSVEKETTIMPVQVDENDLVILYPIDNGELWLFENYCRIHSIIILCIIFIVLILLLCKAKGFNTVISLFLTLITLLFVLLPLIVAGFNIYKCTIVTCVFITFMSLLITHGISKKSIIAALGCSFGVTTSGIIAIIMQHIMKLTGYINDDSRMLYHMFIDYKIDLNGIVFTMIIIGSLGATMDVAMSIASALNEIKTNRKELTNLQFLSSGINIGKDTIGTMSNTLILAYIGSSLSTILIYSMSNYPLLILINKQELIIDFLQSLCGVMGILTTIPITTALCLMLYKDCLKDNY